eukprot:CAMPEP_0197516030 /NCGR_PEP_ID=MMETSP1318-20131121/946_1 /TAXON_ID=552666 /ORGANISM="Partenskyella glossopodia, Strain RCC365" /LENGTH=346 /DNA_ID=CAMNT_0043064535 /DNA_START=86 /DNA_END=1126 /DNA_ORIENTATION=-
MEDAKSLSLSLSEKHPDLSLFGVYDGHAGEETSKYLEKVLPTKLGDLDYPTRKSEIVDAMLEIDEEVLNNPDTRSHGSTCVYALVRPRPSPEAGEEREYEVTIANIGDSRAVLLRKDGRWKLLTRDHKPSLAEERSRIEMAEGKVENDRVDGQLALSRAIGDWNYKLNGKLKPHQQKVIATPDVSRILAREGDCLLICCDGLFEKLSTHEVCGFIHDDLKTSNFEDPAMSLARLLDLSLDKGSKDNMTAIVVLFRNGMEYSRKGNRLIAGRFFESAKDDKFKSAYIAFAKSKGIVGEELKRMIPKTIETEKSPREREFSSVLSQLDPPDRSLLMAMMEGEEKNDKK